MKRGLTVISPLIAAVVVLSPASSRAQGSPPAAAAPAPPITWQAVADVYDASNARLGVLRFADTQAGLLVSGLLTGLPAGQHGIHLHTVGLCEAPFATAGGHFNPSSAKHGYRNPMGHHSGDMPNITAQPGGAATVEFLVDGLKLSSLLDTDGAAVVVHAGADDYFTDPAGASGARIACGVITATK